MAIEQKSCFMCFSPVNLAKFAQVWCDPRLEDSHTYQVFSSTLFGELSIFGIPAELGPRYGINESRNAPGPGRRFHGGKSAQGGVGGFNVY